MRKALLLTFLSALLHLQVTVAAPYVGTHSRAYTLEHPLIYVDGWEKWPYAFINDDGKPDGFNVDLVRYIMKRLDIPYEIHLCSQDDAHDDLKTNRADLSFGVDAGYNYTYGRFGKVAVTYFENAIIQPRADSIGPYKLSDLKDIPLIVKNDSRAYHSVMDNGFSDSLVTCVDDMSEEVLRIATEGRGAVLWNTMMLKWMVNKYHLTDLAISPVDIPPGKYCFMSGDTLLLHRLDSVCEIMTKEGEIERLKTRWMYPERATADNTYIYIVLAIAFVLAVIGSIIYGVRYYRKYYSRNSLTDINSQMGLVLQSNNMQVWVYFPLTRRYAWMTRDGKVNEEYSSFDFSQFYPDNDFNIIHTQVMEFLAHDSEPVVKTLRSYSLDAPRRILDVEVHMQELKDDYGKIYLICGVQHDITDSKAYLERMRMLHERHKVAFNLAIGAILRFDGKGTLIDINERCCVKMGIKDPKAMLQKGYNFSDFGVFEGMDFATMPNDVRFSTRIRNSEMAHYAPIASFDNFNPDLERYHDFNTSTSVASHRSRIPENGYYYIHLVKSHDNEGNLLGMMMFLLDITERVKEDKSLCRMQQQVKDINMEKEKYRNLRDYTLRSNSIWMMRYYPSTKMLRFFDRHNSKPQELSQLRVLEIIDGQDMKKVFRSFHRVDAFEDNDVHLNVATLLRNEQGEQIHFSLDVHPVYDNDGKVESYFGICRDVTHQLMVHQKLKSETQRAREAEHLRQTFLKNMSYSIRQPLVSMRQNIAKLSDETDENMEKQYLQSIISNTQRLITLSDDTLLLSRIEAGLLTPAPVELDFVALYKEVVNDVIEEYRTDTVIYKVEDLYESLPIRCDRDMLTRILREAVSLSARYTQYGTMSVRYMYRKGMLTIVVEDTEHGLPPSILSNIFEPRIGGAYSSEMQSMRLSGLEMPICKALVDLLNGSIDIESEAGKGASTFIVLPIQEQ